LATNGSKPEPRDCRAWFLRQFGTEQEKVLYDSRRSYPHSHPGSVLVAGIGAMWDAGCWQRVMDMVIHTSDQGFNCWFDEIIPAAGDALPMADIGYMRDMAVMRALDAGFEYVCLVDSDVQPEPDALIRLMSHELTMVSPYMEEPGTDYHLGDPTWKKGTGLKRMRWIPASFMLFRPTIFNCPGVFFRATRDDDLFFQQLWHYGMYPLLDTDVEVKLTRPPRRLGGRSWEERWDFLKDLYERSGNAPDRSPIDPNDPNTVDGVYSPLSLPVIREGV
jgi:hypothetical protein